MPILEIVPLRYSSVFFLRKCANGSVSRPPCLRFHHNFSITQLCKFRAESLPPKAGRLHAGLGVRFIDKLEFRFLSEESLPGLNQITFPTINHLESPMHVLLHQRMYHLERFQYFSFSKGTIFFCRGTKE